MIVATDDPMQTIVVSDEFYRTDPETGEQFGPYRIATLCDSRYPNLPVTAEVSANLFDMDRNNMLRDELRESLRRQVEARK